MTGPRSLRSIAESLYEEIGGDLCICQRADVPHWCENCQVRLDRIVATLADLVDGHAAHINTLEDSRKQLRATLSGLAMLAALSSSSAGDKGK